MSAILAIGGTIAFILIFFVIPSWAFDKLDRGGSKNVGLKMLQGFIAELYFGIVGTIGGVVMYGIIRAILKLIIPSIGKGTSKGYWIVALCVFSVYTIIALYKVFYTIIIIHKHPEFKGYYLNHSYFNAGKDDFKEYSDKKKQWGITSFISPKKIKYYKYLFFYDILGLDSSASIDEIKRAYREKAQQYHPDKYFNATEEERKMAEKKFVEIKDAYEQLIKYKKMQ